MFTFMLMSFHTLLKRVRKAHVLPVPHRKVKLRATVTRSA
jgi:hypothetical protein